VASKEVELEITLEDSEGVEITDVLLVEYEDDNITRVECSILEGCIMHLLSESELDNIRTELQESISAEKHCGHDLELQRTNG